MRTKLVPLAAIAGDTQAIAVAWARYAEEVVRHTSEASQARLRAHMFKEMLEGQAKLRRDSMQSFHDQIVKIARNRGPEGDAPAQCAEGGEHRTSRRLASAVGTVVPIWRPKTSTIMRVDF